ncbi:threonine--tRNA ligase 1, cytoplasmic-like [Convolutriloba macropyga]|uniref:threonine--tRNA ligase 1, cytoplasmic-like n=1 Tax=Convolutriloba macropyga TaxID=536237 RepID=UPI003F51B931
MRIIFPRCLAEVKKQYRSVALCRNLAKMPAGGDAENKHPLKLVPQPEFIQKRDELFKTLVQAKKDDISERASLEKEIVIKLPDNSEKQGIAWKTTPFDIAQSISQGLAQNAIVAKVNGELWDLERPFETDVDSLEILKFDHPEAKQVYWHSTAHVLGEALELHFGAHLCYGPPIESGFYYDMHSPERTVTPKDYAAIETLMKEIIKAKQPFERLSMKKADLLDMFSYNEFKCRILNNKVKEDETTVYKCGDLIDLCRGPHVRHTGNIKAVKVTKSSSSFWEGNAEMETLQRVYGISFPDKKLLQEYEHMIEEAAKRDHRKIGREQELYFFHELSPGSAFFHPKGAHIYNTLQDFFRKQYRKRGFQEVISPNMYNSKLWITSGHWKHYSDDMFQIDVEEQKFALKPMNCPGHCVMFGMRSRSWRELPLRMADFGVLHRNELSGALTGLTRVRRFQQDDAHIFCTPEQVKSEIEAALEFMSFVYTKFGFTYKLNLSTRPKKYMGEIKDWDEAESQLKEALDAHCNSVGDGMKWILNPEDGAFYGPKIDITIQDAMKRDHQLATIQLDFQLPKNFQLEYVNQEGVSARPVIIHRAILGSIERCISVLTEQYGGKWPFWLSPRQIIVVSVVSAAAEYVQNIQRKLYESGFECECDVEGDTVQKKIRNGQIAQFNFILVCGVKEMESNTINVRTRDNKVHGEFPLEELIRRFSYLKDTQSLNAEEEFVNVPPPDSS